MNQFKNPSIHPSIDPLIHQSIIHLKRESIADFTNKLKLKLKTQTPAAAAAAATKSRVRTNFGHQTFFLFGVQKMYVHYLDTKQKKRLVSKKCTYIIWTPNVFFCSVSKICKYARRRDAITPANLHRPFSSSLYSSWFCLRVELGLDT